MRPHVRLAAALLATILTVACGSSPTSPSGTGGAPGGLPSVPVMGSARLSASQLVNWFNRRQPQPTGVYGATEPVEALVAYFIEEGAREGVAGDVAFVQSIIETGWFRFSGTPKLLLETKYWYFSIVADTHQRLNAKIVAG